jgi:hypothetical protein
MYGYRRSRLALEEMELKDNGPSAAADWWTNEYMWKFLLSFVDLSFVLCLFVLLSFVTSRTSAQAFVLTS